MKNKTFIYANINGVTLVILCHFTYHKMNIRNKARIMNALRANHSDILEVGRLVYLQDDQLKSQPFQKGDIHAYILENKIVINKRGCIIFKIKPQAIDQDLSIEYNKPYQLCLTNRSKNAHI